MTRRAPRRFADAVILLAITPAAAALAVAPLPEVVIAALTVAAGLVIVAAGAWVAVAWWRWYRRE